LALFEKGQWWLLTLLGRPLADDAVRVNKHGHPRFAVGDGGAAGCWTEFAAAAADEYAAHGAGDDGEAAAAAAAAVSAVADDAALLSESSLWTNEDCIALEVEKSCWSFWVGRKMGFLGRAMMSTQTAALSWGRAKPEKHREPARLRDGTRTTLVPMMMSRQLRRIGTDVAPEHHLKID
jgi:hypothetical protein